LIDVVFAAVLLVFAAALVVLFAMFGELTARLPTLNVDYRDPTIRVLSEAKTGSKPEQWPRELTPLIDGGDALLVVLSTACQSCESVGRQMNELNGHLRHQTGVILSYGDLERGRDFVRRHHLNDVPLFLDEEGNWVKHSFGVQTSPTGLVIRNGALQAALVFTDINALAAAAELDGASQQSRPLEVIS
jgi:hypothetical protein